MTERSPSPANACPICGKQTNAPFQPFCSKRCADVDLNRWLSGAYVVPGHDEEGEDGVTREKPPA